MAVRVLAALKGRSCVFGSLSYTRQTSGVLYMQYHVVGDRKDACALRYPMCINSAFRGMTIRIEEICV